MRGISIACGVLLAATCVAQPVPAAQSAGTGTQAVKAKSVHAMHPRQSTSPFNSSLTSVHASDYYQMHWGVDSLVVKSVPSDQLIRFSYRVTDSTKAKIINGKEASPQLYDQQSGVSLVVPTMDKVGQLRQSGPPENGKIYWMVFSNKGNLVKAGHRVGVVVGQFRANGLAVE